MQRGKKAWYSAIVARVIKAGEGPRAIDGAVVDAKEEAARIVASARAEADAVCEEARRAGFAAGREEGLASVTELAARLRAEASRREEEAAPELRRLAVRIAEKILGRELQLAPDAVVDVVRAAIVAARARRELVVRVHPDDLAAVAAAAPRLAAELARRGDVAVRGDAAVPRGGCLVDTEVGTIDARLDVQLAAIERALLGDA